METHEIRRRFLGYFEKTGHTVVPSASLISEDPTLLFTVAGMVPFKPYFLGQATPPFPRATSVQKCVRTLDIENVGVSQRHNTFFQMAGNFSFGDYFKEGAIKHAWDAAHRVAGRRRLRARPGPAVGHRLRDRRRGRASSGRASPGCRRSASSGAGMADNFWSMGVAGPCGPCSEIYYDRGPEFGIEGGPIADEDRYLEIWNLVFMQDMRGESTGR